MKKIFKFKLSIINFALFLIPTSAILGLNLTPLILHIRHAPVGRTFNLIHNNVQDFYFYQSLMNEGGNGAWLTTDPFTSESHRPSVIFSYFLWLGKLSKILGLSYALTYHLLRVTLGFLFLLFSFILILELKFPHPRLTYLLFIFAAPLLHQVSYGGKSSLQPFMYFWTGIDPVRRAAYLPHHMFGGLFLVISLILIIKYIRTDKRKFLWWLIPIAPVLAFIHTPSLFIILLILPPALLIYFLKNINKDRNPKSEARDPKQIQNLYDINSKRFENSNLSNLNLIRYSNFDFRIYIGLFVYWVIGLSSLILMFSQTGRGFPWSQYVTWEKTQQFPLIEEFFGALGILLPVALIGFFRSLFERKFEYLLTAGWFAVPIFLIPIASILNISNIRLIQGVPYLPLSILAVIGIQTLLSIITRLVLSKLKTQMSNVKTESQISKLKRLKVLSFNFEFCDLRLKIKKLFSISNILWVIILIIFVRYTIPTLVWSLKDQIREYWTVYSNVYLDKGLYPAFDFINRNVPPKTVTIATFYTGNYLPAFTNTVSFIGHTGYTDNLDIKQPQVDKFFASKMKEEEARDFLSRNKITLVFQGPDEKSSYNGVLYPGVLKKIYDTQTIILYSTGK